MVKRKNRAYKLVPVSDDDMLMEIPVEYRVDPYEISPSGDVFWADKRNVEKVKKAFEEKGSPGAIINSVEDLKRFVEVISAKGHYDDR